MKGQNQLHPYLEYPRTRAGDDYWGQIKRTVGGQPVGEDQIQMIVDSVLSGLQIEPDDVLLDFCCGNGALTDRIFARCRGGLGVDFSPPLIEVAKRDFERPGERNYRLQDATEFAETTVEVEGFTKALCYGSFPYLSARDAERLLTLVCERFPSIERLMVGNLPDRAKAVAFLGPHYRPGVEDDPDAPLGIWRTEDQFISMARQAGWACVLSRPQPPFYGAGYRYDAVLTRLEK